MANINVRSPHSLSEAEARRRVERLLATEVPQEFGGQISNYHYTFNANTGRGTLRFRASVATIQGTVVVKANYVEVSCTLPWTVAAFKHSIEQAIKTRAAKVLA